MYAGRNNLYDSVIRRMVRQSLAQKEQDFRQSWQEQPDEALLEYLRQGAKRIGHSPHEREILGGEYLSERFGGWDNVLERAGLPQPVTPDSPQQFARIREETLIQQKHYREKKAEKRRKAQQRRAEQERKKKMTPPPGKKEQDLSHIQKKTEDAL